MHMCFESIQFKMYTKRSAGAIMIQRLLRKYAVQQQQRLRTLSREAQKAVWARHLIGVIEGASAPRSLRSQSLREKVLELQAPSKEFEFCAAVRTEMLSPFGVGIELPPFARHLDALAKGTQQGSPLKFVFCPTMLTTKPIFRCLEREVREDIFVWGPPGIAKTASVILYLHLNSYITRFYFEAQSDAAKLEELRELQRRQLLSNTIFKYFYWGLTKDDHKTKRLIQSLIVEQATELDEAARSTLKNQIDPLEFCRLLHSQYPQNIELRTIPDHLNILTSLLYKCYTENMLQQLLNKYKEGKQQQQIIKARADRCRNQLFLPMLNLNNKLSLMTFITGRYCAISSYPIQNWHHETDFYLRANSLQNKHDRRISYQSQLEKPGGSYDFLQLVWFEIAQRVSCSASIDISSTKEMFCQAVSAQDYQGFLRIDDVRLMLDAKKQFFHVSSEHSSRLLVEKVVEGLRVALNERIQTEVQLLQQFFGGEDSNRKIALFKGLAERQLLDPTRKHAYLRYYASRTEFSIIDEEFRAFCSEEAMRNWLLREKVPIEFINYQKAIDLPWTPSQFLKLLSLSGYFNLF